MSSTGCTLSVGTNCHFDTGWPDLVNTEAFTEPEISQILDLRRSVYGSLGMNFSIRDRYDDDVAGRRLFLLQESGQVVGTVRACFGNVNDPNTYFGPVFTKQLKALAGQARYLEAGRLAITPSKSPKECRRLLALIQNVTALLDETETPFLIAPTRSDHTKFYRGMGFEVLVPPLLYPGMPNMVTVLVLDWRSHREKLRIHPRYRRVFSLRNNPVNDNAHPSGSRWPAFHVEPEFHTPELR
jgi:hypothetical protein